MNMILNASLNAKLSLNEIANKVQNISILDIAHAIKHDENRVNEFVSTFMHRKKISAKMKWESLVLLNKKEEIFNLIDIDSEGNISYTDENLVKLGIERYSTLLGIPFLYHEVFQFIHSNKNLKKLHPFYCTIKIMHSLVKEFEPFIYSEFSDKIFDSTQLLEVMDIVNEMKEA